MSDEPLDKRYLSIKWQAFGLTSIVLTTILAAFLYFISESTLRQFEIGRSHVYSQNKQQLDNLIEVAAERTIQIANTAILSNFLKDVLAINDATALRKVLEDLSWSLQVDVGIEGVSAFDRHGVLIESSSRPAQQSLATLILKSESPQWAVTCSSKCFIEAGTPVLSNGVVVGVIVLSEPLSNVMLRFEHIANINTALLTNVDATNEFYDYIPSWEKSLVALTNPQDSKAIISEASNRYSLQELTEGIHLVEIENNVFELRALPIKTNQVVIISNVSQDFWNMKKSKRDSIQISIVSLIVAECLLLILLWRPMSRIRKTALILPLLAERRFSEARTSFRQLAKQSIFRDETDILNVTALKLSDELESLQEQLDVRAEQLAVRGRELESERDFVSQLLDTVHAIIIIQDEHGMIQLPNKSAVALSGYSTRELRGRSFCSLLDDSAETGQVALRIKDLITGHLSEHQHESYMSTRDGGRLHLAWRHAVLYDQEGSQRQVLSVAVDISARVKAEAEVAWLANHDVLSGLYNRRRFDDELNVCFAAAKRENTRYGLVLMDLNCLGATSNTSSRQAEDVLVQLVAQSLKRQVRASEFLARVSSERFAIIIRDVEIAELDSVAVRLLTAIMAVDASVEFSTNLGIALMSANQHGVSELWASAGSALAAARQKGRDCYEIFNVDAYVLPNS